MRTVQMTIEPKLVAEVDRLARRLGVTRSAFTCRALRAEIDRLRVEDLECRPRGQHIVTPNLQSNLQSEF